MFRPFSAKRILEADFVGGMQILDIGCDLDTIDIHPRSLADSVASVHRRCSTGGLRAEISVPGLGAGADLRCQILAMFVRTGEPAEIGALGSADAADEERHVGIFGRQRLRLQFPGQNRKSQAPRLQKQQLQASWISPHWVPIEFRLRTNPRQPISFIIGLLASLRQD